MDLEENSDPESLLKVAQIEIFYYNQYRTAMKAYQYKAAEREQTTQVPNQSEFEKAQVQSQKTIGHLGQVSQQVTHHTEEKV
ncbi:uncharacterized protein CIMG_13492 [Coccidioides immitis RS]|uniref:Uncharacterized protein n=1 Tax=Coccidioides immitis (strain RS) TaxID=246410 RepID=A0A0D8JY81_COCIM|nr:uncharacterized protein CIMG_13492 [Coccidioides immitis RS]KJF61208.1 hypothetical protein CIMG_13492 [Coccidioides immitis RS]